ncbi:glutathione S-transferase [Luteibacter sp. Sphag1AF]|uniref:glutathione S-transferase family protein n=1 Tax=Luteibacter sp. Sphag1AF TaxID=2587031 RepID=UPI0016195B0D|nr:glutathione S-transferase [Luteibacter sp. Sphag1AF]MBB3225913.1 glutathione S-transferase [Luteibacter sp. Sphag1AF]
MRLIGMLDSPFVRRVAVSCKFMGLPFTHEALSVFRDYDAFAAINPAVKAPSFVTDDGVVLMDSSLILDYLERLALPERRLTPADIGEVARSLRIVGLAQIAAEKAVQIYYELNKRPDDKRHQPWLDRAEGQLHGVYAALENELGDAPGWLFGQRPMLADITTVTAWRFSKDYLSEYLHAERYPRLAAFSARAEALPEFESTPAE